MTSYYVEGGNTSIISFDTDPHEDINADAKKWHPKFVDKWVDCPGSTGIGSSVLWSGDYYPIPEEQVPDFQDRCRRAFATHMAGVAATRARRANRD